MSSHLIVATSAVVLCANLADTAGAQSFIGPKTAIVDQNGNQLGIPANPLSIAGSFTATTTNVVSSGTVTATTLGTAGTAQAISAFGTFSQGISLQDESTSDTFCVSTSSSVTYSASTTGSASHCPNGWMLQPGQTQGYAFNSAGVLYWVGPNAGDVLGISAQ